MKKNIFAVLIIYFVIIGFAHGNTMKKYKSIDNVIICNYKIDSTLLNDLNNFTSEIMQEKFLFYEISLTNNINNSNCILASLILLLSETNSKSVVKTLIKYINYRSYDINNNYFDVTKIALMNYGIRNLKNKNEIIKYIGFTNDPMIINYLAHILNELDYNIRFKALKIDKNKKGYDSLFTKKVVEKLTNVTILE